MTDEFDRRDRGVDPTYDSEEGVYRLHHDFGGDGRLSLTILVGLERISLDEPDREAGSLFEAVDPDGLDALFAPGTPLPVRNDGTVTFPTGDYRVTVHADGTIEIEPD